MSEDSSLKQLKRRVYLDYHQDGIIDVLIGAAILGFGLWNWLDQPIFAYTVLLCFGSYIQLKNTITVPRFGYVRFTEGKRETGLLIGIGIGVVLLALVVVILYLLGPDRVGLFPVAFLRKFHVFVMGSIGAVIMTIFGLWGSIRRLIGYALLLLATLAAAYWLEVNGGIALIVFGGCLMLIGLLLMLRFISTNPITSGEANHAA